MSDEEAISKLVADRVIHVVENDGAPVPHVDVVRVASNGTFLQGTTDEKGEWPYVEPFLGTVTFLAASVGWSGAVAVMENADWDGPLELRMEVETEGGSVIVRQGTGFVPGLEGRLNPIRDAHGRTYIYGDNLSFDDRPDQPHRFVANSPFDAEDSLGNRFQLSILAILGRTSLIRYRLLRRSPISE